MVDSKPMISSLPCDRVNPQGALNGNNQITNQRLDANNQGPCYAYQQRCNKPTQLDLAQVNKPGNQMLLDINQHPKNEQMQDLLNFSDTNSQF